MNFVYRDNLAYTEVTKVPNVTGAKYATTHSGTHSQDTKRECALFTHGARKILSEDVDRKCY